jgi:hypothetical protein
MNATLGVGQHDAVGETKRGAAEAAHHEEADPAAETRLYDGLRDNKRNHHEQHARIGENVLAFASVGYHVGVPPPPLPPHASSRLLYERMSRHVIRVRMACKKDFDVREPESQLFHASSNDGKRSIKTRIEQDVAVGGCDQVIATGPETGDAFRLPSMRSKLLFTLVVALCLVDVSFAAGGAGPASIQVYFTPNIPEPT